MIMMMYSVTENVRSPVLKVKSTTDDRRSALACMIMMYRYSLTQSTVQWCIKEKHRDIGGSWIWTLVWRHFSGVLFFPNMD